MAFLSYVKFYSNYVFYQTKKLNRRKSLIIFFLAAVIFCLTRLKAADLMHQTPSMTLAGENLIVAAESTTTNSTLATTTTTVVQNGTAHDPAVKKFKNQNFKNIESLKVMEEVEDDALFNSNSNNCPYEEWNDVHTERVPNAEMHTAWRSQELGYKKPYLNQGTPSVFAAYVYKTHISVILTSENYYGKAVYCRYYDCHREEIVGQFVAYVFPESTVHCARRKGAKYISITETLEEKPNIGVPLQKRLRPQHYFTICMAPLFGEEPKFLQLVEFIEYYKLQGATFFHIYVRNASSYDRNLLDDYARTNDIEVIKVHDSFWREDYMWSRVEINDCLHRSKYFSKWTALLDIDDRIEIKNAESSKVSQFLDTITDPNINVLQVAVQRVLKTGSSPEKYINEKQLAEQIEFRKYATQVGANSDQSKYIIRPDRIAVMDNQRPYAVYQGDLLTAVDKAQAVVRHYYTTHQNQNSSETAMDKNGPLAHQKSSMSPKLAGHLAKAIMKRVKFVYDIAEPTCEQKEKAYKSFNISFNSNLSCGV